MGLESGLCDLCDNAVSSLCEDCGRCKRCGHALHCKGKFVPVWGTALKGGKDEAD